MRRRFHGSARLAAAFAAALAAACALAAAAAPVPAAAARAGGSVSLLYAGSLVNVMEERLLPAFEKASGITADGLPGGSQALASTIKGGLQRADVFVSAAPSVNAGLEGAANGGWVRWYGEFASAPLVIAYSPHSRFAADFRTKPWWKVFEEPGIRIGRTDPVLDPKGALTVEFVKAEQKLGHRPGLLRRILGSAENQSQIFPEQTLLGRLDTGQLDAGFFYSVEAVDAKLPYVAPKLGARYGARYTITIPRGGANPAGALRFVEYVLGPAGRKILKQEGFHLLHGEIGGDPSAAPPGVRALLSGST